MFSKDVLRTYNEAPYINSTKDAKGNKLIYKHRSALNFIDFIEECVDKEINFSGWSTSQQGGAWAGSKDFPTAVKKFRECKYDAADAKRKSNLIIKMRSGVKFVDAGDEPSIPEFLAQSQEYFIEYVDRRRKKPPVLSHPIFINLTDHAGVDEKDIEKAGSVIVDKLYEYKVRVPNIVMCYLTEQINYQDDLYMFIDVPYFDFNSLKRFSFSSTFRRIAFVNFELVKGLSMGYGIPARLPAPKTLHDVIPIGVFTNKSEEQIGAIMDKVIQETFK